MKIKISIILLITFNFIKGHEHDLPSLCKDATKIGI